MLRQIFQSHSINFFSNQVAKYHLRIISCATLSNSTNDNTIRHRDIVRVFAWNDTRICRYGKHSITGCKNIVKLFIVRQSAEFYSYKAKLSIGNPMSDETLAMRVQSEKCVVAITMDDARSAG